MRIFIQERLNIGIITIPWSRTRVIALNAQEIPIANSRKDLRPQGRILVSPRGDQASLSKNGSELRQLTRNNSTYTELIGSYRALRFKAAFDTVV